MPEKDEFQKVTLLNPELMKGKETDVNSLIFWFSRLIQVFLEDNKPING